jgi:hypothetical protein
MDDSSHQGFGAKHLSLSSAHWSTRFRYTAPQKACAQMCYRRGREGSRLSEPALLGSVLAGRPHVQGGTWERRSTHGPCPSRGWDGIGAQQHRGAQAPMAVWAHRRAVAGRREPLCTHG